MDDFIVARAVHVVAVLLWIGGVAFVTTVLLPAVRRSTPPGRRLEEFHRVEARFAPQARLFHRNEPLRRGAEHDRRLVAPAMRIAVLQRRVRK